MATPSTSVLQIGILGDFPFFVTVGYGKLSGLTFWKGKIQKADMEWIS
jgi:hypothetical protein